MVFKIKRIMLLMLLSLFLLSSSALAISSDSNLIGHWKLEDTSDSSGNGYNLYSTTPPTLTSTNCYENDCYDWDDGNDIWVTGASLVGFNEFTMSAWVYLDGSINTNGVMGASDNTTGSSEAVCYITSANTLYCDSIGFTSLSYASVGDGNLTHITYTNDGTTHRIYINGVQQTSGVGTLGSISNEFFRIGKYANVHPFDGKIDDVSLWNKSLNTSQVSNLYSNGIEYISAPVLEMIINSPSNGTNYSYNTSNVLLDVDTNYNSTCDVDSTPFTTTGLLNHSHTYSLNAPNHSIQTYNLNISCFSEEAGNLTVSEILTFFQDAYPPLNITSAEPDNVSYTFDIENVNLQVTTDYDSVCNYTINNVTVNLTSIDGLIHNDTYNMGSAQNYTKQFDVEYSCYSAIIDGSDSVNRTFYQEQTPLALEIFVPQDQQRFDFGTNLITFHIETNYQSICNYNVTNLNSTPIISEYDNFTITNSNIHRTNYTALFPTVREYPLTFTCDGTLINESVNLSVLFYLDEELTLTGLTAVEETTSSAFSVIGTLLSGINDLYLAGGFLVLILFGLFTVFLIGVIGLLFYLLKVMLSTSLKGGKLR